MWSWRGGAGLFLWGPASVRHSAPTPGPRRGGPPRFWTGPVGGLSLFFEGVEEVREIGKERKELTPTCQTITTHSTSKKKKKTPRRSTTNTTTETHPLLRFPTCFCQERMCLEPSYSPNASQQPRTISPQATRPGAPVRLRNTHLLSRVPWGSGFHVSKVPVRESPSHPRTIKAGQPPRGKTPSLSLLAPSARRRCALPS